MQRWTLVDSGDVPGSNGVMELYQAPHELAIRVDGRQLMSSRVHGSEDALADLACERLGHRPDLRILIGGLGMGFTLAAALSKTDADARITVAELVPAIIRWNRGPLAPVANHPLQDPRAVVFEGDVAEAMRAGPGVWDAILLDVDNGPEGLTRESNGWLYGRGGLSTAHRALKPGGILAVWSAAPDDRFTGRLRRAGFDVEVVGVRANGKKGGRRHVIWLATRV